MVRVARPLANHRAPASIFGYDLVHDSAGNWWGTGLFAN